MNTIDFGQRLTHSLLQYVAVASQPEVNDQPKTAESLYFDKQPNTFVTISQQAREKLALVQKQNLNQKSLPLSKANESKTQSSNNTMDKMKDLLDKLIEDVQKQISKARRQLNAIKLIDTKKAETERKALQAKLISLNAMLLHLLSKQLEPLNSQ